jgi:hypothetical protein
MENSTEDKVPEVKPEVRIPGVETEEERLKREQMEMLEEALRMNF